MLCYSRLVFLIPIIRLYMCVFFVGLCSVAQTHPTLCDRMDRSPPGSSVHGIPQARILEWVAISFSQVQVHFNLFLAANIKQIRAIRSHWSSDWISTFSDNWGCHVKYMVCFNPRALVIPFTACDTNSGPLSFCMDPMSPNMGTSSIATRKLKDAYSLERKLWPT